MSGLIGPWEILILIGLWVSVSYHAAKVAQRRGLSFAWVMIAGLCFSPILALVLAYMRPEQQKGLS